MLEIGAECDVIVDQASGEGRDAGVREREREGEKPRGSVSLSKQSWRQTGTTQDGVRTVRRHVKEGSTNDTRCTEFSIKTESLGS